ncbi:hypothetical protein JYU15_01875, partial [bacterium AH-315-I18]|nr:hypothetical protein [bacterium AH-315-I18]
MNTIDTPYRLTDPLTASPKHRWAWLAMLALCAIPLLTSLGTRDTWHTMENITLASSTEVFITQHGWNDTVQNDDAWIVPTWRGQPRLNKPPLAVWLNLMAWSDLDPATTNPRQLMFRARVVSVIIGLIMIASIYWLGLSIGNVHIGLLGALSIGTTLLFQRQARLASYDIHLASFATFGVAAAWWAIGPHQAQRAFKALRYTAGWILAGIGLGAAIMSKGPLAYPLLILPVLLCIVMHRKRLLANLGGLLIALAVGTALAFPWYYHIFTHNKNLATGLASEYAAHRQEYQAVYYYVGLIGLIWPWSIIFFGALFQPWGLAQKSRRKQMLYAWGWMAVIFVMFSIPAAKQQRYILPILPALGLMFGAFWVDHQRISDAGQQDKGLNWVRIPHWVMLVCAPLVIGALSLGYPWLINHDYQNMAVFGPVHPALILGWIVLCSGIAYLGIKNHWQNQHLKAGYLNILWALIFTCMILHSYSIGQHQHHPVYNEAMKFNQIVKASPVRFLHTSDHHDEINEEFAFFSMRIITPINTEELGTYLKNSKYPANETRFIMVLDNEHASDTLKKAGLNEVFAFNQDYHENKMLTHLWAYTPKQV